MSWKILAAVSLLGVSAAGNAAVLFTKSGTLLPDFDGYFFSVPTFAYNVPFTIDIQLSRSLVENEYLDILRGYSTEWHLYEDGDMIDYDYWWDQDSLRFTEISHISLPDQNYYFYNSWPSEDWEGNPVLMEEKYWTALEEIWLESYLFTPLDWTVTISGPVPEPASWALMIGGFGLVGLAARRRAGRYSITS